MNEERADHMKINRLQLITIIQSEITRLQDRARARHDAHREREDTAAQRYVEETREGWREFTLRIRNRVNDGLPVTYDDVPEALRARGVIMRGIRFFDNRPADVPVPAIFNPDTVPGVPPLTTLRGVLAASDDDDVSTYALEKMGFPLGKTLLRAAALATATDERMDRMDRMERRDGHR
jgi:hypothetical protein